MDDSQQLSLFFRLKHVFAYTEKMNLLSHLIERLLCIDIRERKRERQKYISSTVAID